MTEKQVTEIIEKYIKTGEMVGGALIIYKDGKCVYKDNWGYADIENNRVIGYDSIYRMASLSKVVTAVGIMKLYDEDKIKLDDEIIKYLPGFASPRVVEDERFEGMENLTRYLIKGEKAPIDDVKTVPAEREITIRDLLTHSSGIEMGVYGFISRMKMDYIEDTLASRMDKLSKLALDFQPGTATGYSPTANFDILARIIEVITNMNFDEYMRKEIFDPLGMKDATYYLSQEQKKRLVKLYKFEDGREVDVSGTSMDIDKIAGIGPKFMSGSGGLYCTIEDYDKFVQMLYNEGIYNGVRILKSLTVRKLYTERAYNHLEPEPGMEWGLGVKVRQNPKKANSFASQGTYGWSGAFGTHFFISPNEKLAAVFAMNRAEIGGSGSYISRKVEELVFSTWGNKVD